MTRTANSKTSKPRKTKSASPSQKTSTAKKSRKAHSAPTTKMPSVVRAPTKPRTQMFRRLKLAEIGEADRQEDTLKRMVKRYNSRRRNKNPIAASPNMRGSAQSVGSVGSNSSHDDLERSQEQIMTLMSHLQDCQDKLDRMKYQLANR